MSKQEIQIDDYVLYKDQVSKVKGFAGSFVNIDKPHRENFFVPVSEVRLCNSDGVPMLSPSEGQQE